MFLRLLLRFFYFLFLIFIIRALIRRLFPGSPKQGTSKPASSSTPNSISGHMEKDPVCGMYIDTQTALRTNRNGKAFYFCSESCQKKFLASAN